jgi:hypothetical protein
MQMRGSLHCATDDETVRRFGRDDDSLVGKEGEDCKGKLQRQLQEQQQPVLRLRRSMTTKKQLQKQLQKQSWISFQCVQFFSQVTAKAE